MLDANSLKQLEDSLSLYQETQETLNLVVQNAQAIFGQEWMSKLPTAFDTEPNEGKRTLLKDKATHVVHYYGALAAWQEAHTYLANPSAISAKILSERIPVLEYWLSLFGVEGADVVEKVKILFNQLTLNPAAVQKNPQPVSNLNETSPKEETNKTERMPENANMAREQSVPKAQQAVSNSVQQPVSGPEQPQKANIEKLPETLEKAVAEPEENGALQQHAISQQQNILIEENSEIVEPANIFEENAVQNVSTINTPYQTDLAAQVSSQEIIDPQEVMNGSSRIVTQNWDLANFLRQKRLYDDANNWLSAWCIRMDNKEKTDYPHYGFIVDIMYDLKEKIQEILENQLLEDLIDREIPGGQEAIRRLAAAIDKELDDLPDDLKISTAEKIKLNAREILGAIDDSDEKEYIGPAADGFELMDDPYAASTEQILSDFEKTEKEAQDQIDKLNVIDENENK